MTSESRPVVFLDANVLYPAGIRDILLQLARRGLITVRWSEDVGAEWRRALQRSKPNVSPEKWDRTWQQLNFHYPSALVTGYHYLMDDLQLPDADDRHVLAAAIVGASEVILTANLRDFPSAIVSEHGLEVAHPDDWMRRFLDARPSEFCRAVRDMRRRLRKPPLSVEQHLASLERQGLIETVALLRRRAHLLE